MQHTFDAYPVNFENRCDVHDYLVDHLNREERYALLFLFYYQQEEGMGLYDFIHNMKCSDPLVNETKELFPELLPTMKEAFIKFVGEDASPENLFGFYRLELIETLDLEDDYMLEGFFDRYYETSAKRVLDPIRIMVQEHLEPVTTWTSCLDFYPGYGNVTNDLFLEGASRIDSLTADPIFRHLAKMRFYVLKRHVYKQDPKEDRLDEVAFLPQDPFRFSLKNHKKKYNRIFVQFPWGEAPDLTPGEFKQLWQGTDFADIRLDMESDWKYLALAIKHMDYDGRACLLAPISLEYKQSDQEIRDYFIREGYIEKVIRLPRGMQNGESGPALFIVLSHDNTGIEFDEYDLMDIAMGRRFKSDLEERDNFNPMDPESGHFMGEDGEEYVTLCGGIRLGDIKLDDKPKKDREIYGPKNMKYKDNEEILEAERLDPRYFMIPEVVNGKALEELADVVRGTSLTKKFLDENLYPFATKIELLRLSDIHDGLVTSMHFLRTMPAKAKLLHPGDIIVTRVTSQIDVLIYDGGGKDQVLVDENFFIVRSKGEIDPYYLLAYLKSQVGKEQLEANFRGSQINKLRTQDLKKLEIPIVETGDQEKIARTTKAAQKRIKKQLLELQLAMEQMQEEVDYNF